jgi:translation initiation factor 1
VPAVLLTDYLAASRERNDEERCTWRALFVLPGAAARVFVVAAILVAAGSAAATLHRRSDANVRALVVSHRASIVAASDRYGVDPRLQPVPAKVTARLRLENKGRGGKSVTVVDGLPDNAPFLDELLKAMKRACATGGTTRPGALELAGDVRERLRSLLRERAIAVKG